MISLAGRAVVILRQQVGGSRINDAQQLIVVVAANRVRR